MLVNGHRLKIYKKALSKQEFIENMGKERKKQIFEYREENGETM